MTFEEILPGLKAKKKYVRTGWGGAENYVQLFDSIEQNGEALPVTPSNGSINIRKRLRFCPIFFRRCRKSASCMVNI